MNMYGNMSRYNFNNGNHHVDRNGVSFYKEIEETYGYEEASLLKKWSQSNLDYVKSFNQRIFLLRCRKLKVVPKHLQVLVPQFVVLNLRSMGNRFSNLHSTFQKSILNLEIRDICAHIKNLENHILHLESIIVTIFPSHVFDRFFNFESGKASRQFEESKFKCKKKLDVF